MLVTAIYRMISFVLFVYVIGNASNSLEPSGLSVAPSGVRVLHLHALLSMF